MTGYDSGRPVATRRDLRPADEAPDVFDKGHAVAELKKGSRVTGDDRTTLAADLKKRYEKGESIRLLAESSGRSYGFVHRILSESGTTLRGRGGATRKKTS